MFKFKELMVEGSGLVVISFGRFNPPTTGHEKVIEKVKSVAGSAPFRIYPSHSVGDRDPLPHTKKVAYMRKMFPKYKRNIVADKEAKTVIHIAQKLYAEGFTDVIMVAGSDRVKEFDTLLQKYNGQPDRKGKVAYKFNTIKVVNAGQRDPDAEGVTGMSASKMRAAAADSDLESFSKGIPNTLNDNDKKKLYLDVRKHMGIREAREMGELNDFESKRDAYLTGQVWKIGDIVESNGNTGKVINRGTNYLSFMSEDGKVHKTWLHDIEVNTIVEGLSMMVKDPKTKKKVQLAGGQKLQIDKTVYNTTGITKMQVLVLVAPLSKEKKVMSKQEIEDGLKSGKIKITDTGSVWQPEEVQLGERDYKKEYANYHGKPEQIERRSSRNKARRVMGDKVKNGKDVGHKDNNPLNNNPKNLRNEDPSKNRAEPRLREEDEVDEKYDSDKFFGGKGTPEQRTQLLKLQNKALRALAHSPKQKAIKKEIDALRKEMGMKVSEELDEMAWYNKVKAAIHQMSHPKGYEKMVKAYVDGLKDKKHYNHPSAWASDVAREYDIEPRGLIMYINNLVQKGKLPKELKAQVEEKQPTSFQELIKTINTVKETPQLNEWGEIEEESEYQGRKVTLNKPMKGDVKKSKVYVKNEKGNVVKVEFGDPNMTIKKHIPANRKSFRARHNCDEPGPKWKAKYWSCKAW